MVFIFIWDSGMFLYLVKYMYKILYILLIKFIVIYVYIIWNNIVIGLYYFVEFNLNEIDYLLCVI